MARPAATALKTACVAILLMLVLVQTSHAVATYTITVGTNASAYVGTETATVTGTVKASNGSAPGPNTAVGIRVLSPSGSPLVVGDVTVNSTGGYKFAFVTGGTNAWVAGTYKVNATWGAYPPQIAAVASFTWSLPVTSTTSSTTSSSTSSTTSTTTTSSTTTSKTSTSTTTLPSTTSTTSSTTPTVTQSPTTSSSTTSSGGGIPEFPLGPVAILAFTVMIVGLYLYTRQGARKEAR